MLVAISMHKQKKLFFNIEKLVTDIYTSGY